MEIENGKLTSFIISLSLFLILYYIFLIFIRRDRCTSYLWYIYMYRKTYFFLKFSSWYELLDYKMDEVFRVICDCSETRPTTIRSGVRMQSACLRETTYEINCIAIVFSLLRTWKNGVFKTLRKLCCLIFNASQRASIEIVYY